MKTEIRIFKEFDKLNEKVEVMREMILSLTRQQPQASATFTHKEAALYLNVSNQTLYNLVNQGKVLKNNRADKRNIYSEIELNKYKYGSY